MSKQDVSVKNRHQSLYKGKPQTWKETFRQRCLERLRESRSKHFSSKRPGLEATDMAHNDKDAQNEGCDQTKEKRTMGECGEQGLPCHVIDIQDIMKDEWELMQKEKECDQGYEAMDPSSTIDEMISLFEEIQTELKAEEKKLLENQAMCDAYVQREEQELCHAIQRLHTVEVICPQCEKNPLIINKGVILCMCGLRIVIEQDSINLKNVQDNLDAGLDEHSRQCASKPTFSQAQHFGFSNLIMSCQDCDFLFIVI